MNLSANSTRKLWDGGYSNSSQMLRWRKYFKFFFSRFILLYRYYWCYNRVSSIHWFSSFIKFYSWQRPVSFGTSSLAVPRGIFCFFLLALLLLQTFTVLDQSGSGVLSGSHTQLDTSLCERWCVTSSVLFSQTPHWGLETNDKASVLLASVTIHEWNASPTSDHRIERRDTLTKVLIFLKG